MDYGRFEYTSDSKMNGATVLCAWLFEKVVVMDNFLAGGTKDSSAVLDVVRAFSEG